MKVLFISRSTLLSTPGGDTKQLEYTAIHLKKMGVEVDIHFAKDKINYSSYDLLHFFNIIRPADLLYHAEKSGKPFVISTIFLDYGEFEKKKRRGYRRLFNSLFSEDFIEFSKVIARYFRNQEPIKSKKYLFWGHHKSIQYLIRHASLLLPNSNSEYLRLFQKYGEAQQYAVIPNAIDADLFRSTHDIDEKYKDCLLCVARIEHRKNQLNLIQAVNNSQYKLIIHGRPSPNNQHYYQQCVREAALNVRFTQRLSEKDLYIMYHSARVHILPSYFETTGLASLEAAVMGCNIVISSKGDTVEYFGDLAYYCDPEDPSSIRKAIDEAYAAPFKEELRTRILQNYTWEKAASKTLEAYQNVLGMPFVKG